MSGFAWSTPLALLGIAAVALPILIHMMGRSPARVRRFPSLRFLQASRQLPLNRTRLHDILLLVIRCGALASAAIALAGPRLARDASAGEQTERAVVVVVDTSGSVSRDGSRPQAVVDSAVAGSTARWIVRTADPGRALQAAGAWLGGRRGRHEVVVASDFQLGAVDPEEVRALPAGIDLRFVRLASVRRAGPFDVRSVQGGAALAARVSFSADTSAVSWARGGDVPDPTIEVLAGADERGDAALARRASRVVGAAPVSAVGAVTVIYPGAPERAALLASAGPLRARWQGDVVARLANDPLLAEAAAAADSATGDRPASAQAVVSSPRGRPVVSVASDARTDRLLVIVHAAAGSAASVALHAALARSLAGPVVAAELEPRALSEPDLASLRAEGAAEQAAPADETSSGTPLSRWFWIAALIALAAEWVVRNRMTVEQSTRARDAAG